MTVWKIMIGLFEKSLMFLMLYGKL